MALGVNSGYDGVLEGSTRSDSLRCFPYENGGASGGITIFLVVRKGKGPLVGITGRRAGFLCAALSTGVMSLAVVLNAFRTVSSHIATVCRGASFLSNNSSGRRTAIRKQSPSRARIKHGGGAFIVLVLNGVPYGIVISRISALDSGMDSLSVFRTSGEGAF